MNLLNFSRASGLVLFLTVVLVGMPDSRCLAQPAHYDGIYAGSYSNGEEGFWIAVIEAGDAAENLFVSCLPEAEEGDAGVLMFSGENEAGVAQFYSEETVLNKNSVTLPIDSSNEYSVAGFYNNGVLAGDRIGASEYVGSSWGQFFGDEEGVWILAVKDDGSVLGEMHDPPEDEENQEEDENQEEEFFEFSGGCHPDGFLLGAGKEYIFCGKISGFDVFGSWLATDGQSRGVISGMMFFKDDNQNVYSVGGRGETTCFLSVFDDICRE